LNFLAVCLEERVTDTFAVMLRRARRNARDPERGGQLTQERFAELLAQEPGAMCTTNTTVSNWECGKSQPHRHDRDTLRAIITVLLRCTGLANLAEASALLSCGGYAALSQEEIGGRSEASATVQTQPHLDTTSVADDTVDIRLDARAGQARTLIAIRHQSMEQIPARAILESLPSELRECACIEIVIDQCDLFHNGRLIDPYQAARRQQDVEMRVAALLAQHPEAQLAYFGIAHIPLLFLAGYTLSNRRAVLLFEYDRYARVWDLLQRIATTPPLHLSGLPADIERGQGDVVVRISISYRVTEDTVAEVIPEPLASIELGLDQPHLDAVTSEPQLWAYTRAFREMMDQIHQYLPRATGIHIFYAGPPALAFACGQQVSKTIHPRLVIYNFFGRDQPRYSWGLDFMSQIDSEEFLHRPIVYRLPA
jgi:transcriptional regulator with XRE-family HTH domain